MKIDIRQSTFAGGETSPIFNGRVDLAKYLNSLRRSRNGFITRHGAWMNRSGTKYIVEVKDSSKKVRLVRFNFAAGQNFILEFGDLYVRFIKDGGQVLSAGVPYEVATPYVEADLPRLKFAQVGDIITITHSAYAPRELRRYGNTNWVLTTINFTSLAHGVVPDLSTFIADPQNFPVWLGNKAYIKYDWDAAVTLRPKDYRYKLAMVLRNNSTYQISETLPFEYGNSKANVVFSSGAQIMDPTEPDVWSGAAVAYTTGQIVRDAGGYLYICYTNHVSAAGNAPAIKSTWGNEWWPVVPGYGSPAVEYIGATFSLPEHKPLIGWPGVSAPAGYTLLGFRLYRGEESVFGLIADVGPEIREFQDDGTKEVDFTISPPSGENPFATDFPGVVSFFEQRRVMANTPLRPADVIASKVGDFFNFAWKPLIVDDDAITGITLASQSFEEIRWMLPLRALLLGTNEGVWMLSGSGGANDALTAMSVKARKQVARPAAWLDPVAIDNAALMLQEYGNFVREVLYDYSTDSYQNSDLSVMAEHLFEGRTITSWTYAQHPFGILWATRSDGVLLGLTYSREHEVVAWHWHDTPGLFENICSVAEGQEHAVYVVVNRTIGGATKRYIERFTSRVLPRVDGVIDMKKAVFLDSSMTYDGAPATIFTGLDHLEGESVTALADAGVIGPYVVTAGQIDISAEVPDGASYVTVGLPYTSQLETLDAVVNGSDLKHRWKRLVRAFFEVVEARGLKLGATYDKLIEWRQRTVAMGYGAVPSFTGMESAAVPASFTKSGCMILQQDDPLPVTVISLTRELELGDD